MDVVGCSVIHFTTLKIAEAVVHPSTVEYAETLSTQIKSISEQFNTNNTRLAEVRREKQLARERRDAVGRFRRNLQFFLLSCFYVFYLAELI